MIDELRENLLREKLRVTAAEQTAKEATIIEEKLRSEANQSHSLADQKETEYTTLVACRNIENERNQESLQQLNDSFQALLKERTEEQDNYDRLQVIAEQQSQTIASLQELNRKRSAHFENFRSEVEEVVTGLKEEVSDNDIKVVAKLKEMAAVTGRMRWVMALDRDGKALPSHSTAA